MGRADVGGTGGGPSLRSMRSRLHLALHFLHPTATAMGLYLASGDLDTWLMERQNSIIIRNREDAV